MESPTDEEMVGVRQALASCSSEAKRLLSDDVLAIPMVQHMLRAFLLDKSRSFEDWIFEPQCRYNLERLRDRTGSVDAPAVTANYEEQYQLASHERLRASTGVGSSAFGGGGVDGGDGRATESGGWGNGGGSDSGGVAASAAAATAAATFRGDLPAPAGTTEGRNSVVSGGGGGGGRDGGDDKQANIKHDDEEEGCRKGATTFADGVAPAASPWSTAGAAKTAVTPMPPLPQPPPPPPQEISRNISPVESTIAGADEEENGSGEDDVYDMLMVMSEAIKEEAKGRFRTGDYMGAAKAYHRAATTLDERAPPTANRHEPLRRRLRELYGTCMCNAAVAGFKAAAASPAPGEAHNLVVGACSRALERFGGKCPKARFWRARVKICQRMYEAAEADLRKAVEEEEEEEEEEEARDNGEVPIPNGTSTTPNRASSRPNGTSTAPNGTSPSPSDTSATRNGAASVADGSNGTCITPGKDEKEDTPSGTADGSSGSGTFSGSSGTSSHSAGPIDTPAVVSNGTGSSAAAPTDSTAVASVHGNHDENNPAAIVGSGGAVSAGDGVKDNSPPSAAAAAEADTAAGGGDCGGGRVRGGGGGGKTKKKASEAARWLARVQAKIAEMDSARALAAEQASAREESAGIGRQRDLEMAQRRARYGPGHVPRRSPPSAEGGVPDTEREGCSEEGRGTTDGSADVVPGWKVPRPPPLKISGRSPAMVLNTYSMQAKFQALPEYEQITGEEGQAEYMCSIKVGPEDRIVGIGRGSSMKAAKQQASREVLVNAALAWNEENPGDPIDMKEMEPMPIAATSSQKKPPTEITEEFKVYCAVWVEKVVAEEVHEACFPNGIDKSQRQYVHGMVEDLNNPGVLSKSATVKGRRQLSVMRRSMMEGMAFMSGDSVVVVDMPQPPTSPADVGDLASITRPPPERKTAAEEEVPGASTSKTADPAAASSAPGVGDGEGARTAAACSTAAVGAESGKSTGTAVASTSE
ncbi:unnamed protein product [Pylaiella littoralis]